MELRQLAYEMAVCVCDADNLLTPLEKGFLDQLRQVLRLDPELATRIEKDTEAVAFSDFSGAEPTNHTAQVNPAVAAVAEREQEE